MKPLPEALKRLHLSQHDFYKRAIELERHQVSLFEAPTGFGKSVIVDTIAETLALGKEKIIIVTATNQLAIELLEIFKDEDKFHFDQSLKVDIVVGKNNYFDVANITDEVYEYVDKKQIITYIENIENNYDYLIEKLFNTIDIEEPHKKIVKDIICAKEKIQGFVDFDELDISITNYHNLLTNVFYSKTLDLSKYIIIGDEVHQMVEVAENMLTNSFSLFRMRSLTRALEKELDGVGSKSTKLKKLLSMQKDILSSQLDRYSLSSRAGDFYTASNYDENSISYEVKQAFLHRDKTEDGKLKPSFSDRVEKLISKELKTFKSPDLQNAYKRYQSERREMLSVVTSPDNITVYLSPSKGYPTLNSAKGDVRGFLLTYFWDKIKAFIGVSATIKVDERDSGAFTRLGLVRGSESQWDNKLSKLSTFVDTFNRLPSKEDKEDIFLYDFLERQKEGYVEGWLSSKREKKLEESLGYGIFSGLKKGEKTRNEEIERVEHIKYGVISYEPVFKREQAHTYLPSEDLISPKTQGEEGESEWLDMIASTIAEKHDNKNCMVICGSFYEVEALRKRLDFLLGDSTPIHSAQRNTPSAQTIEAFKREGGILLGTRNYGVGVNLPNKLLEKLFIVKLPFPIFTIKKWLDIKENDRKLGTSFYYSTYNGEMYSSFRQWIGRLIRSLEDRGELYLLDSRYNKKMYKKRLTYWLKKMSILHENAISAPEMKVEEGASFGEQTVIKLLDNSKCDDDIRTYILGNIVEVITKKNFPVALSGVSRDFKQRYKKFRVKYEPQLKEAFNA